MKSAKKSEDFRIDMGENDDAIDFLIKPLEILLEMRKNSSTRKTLEHLFLRINLETSFDIVFFLIFGIIYKEHDTIFKAIVRKFNKI